MTDIDDLRARASAARKAKRYDEALSLYQELWLENRTACNEWDGWGLAYVLRKNGETEDALDVCREVFRQHRDFKAIRNVYAWCIYDLHLKIEEITDVQRFDKAANAVLDLCDPDDHYSPYVRTVFRVLDHLKVNGSPEKMLEWTDKLDVNKLSNDTREFTDSRGKRIEIASDRERWFSLRTKALEKSGRMDECRRVCEQALQEIAVLHYDNEIWFRRRMALAKAAAGEAKEAIADLKTLFRKRKEWFLCGDIARLSADLGDDDQTIDYAIEALLLPGDLEKKWELSLLLAEAYERTGNLSTAREHARLAVALRAEHGWKSTSRLNEVSNRLKADSGSDETAEAIRSRLAGDWRAYKESKRPRTLGRVKHLLANGKAGFVRADDGKEYYFPLRAFRGKRRDLVPQVRVSFVLEESFDRRKNRPSLQATEIQVVREG